MSTKKKEPLKPLVSLDTSIITHEPRSQEKPRSDFSKKITFTIEDETLFEKFEDFRHWEGYSQQELIIELIENLVKDKDIKARPDRVKDRKRGRKKKK